MKRYEVVESRIFVRDDGLKASIYGACPWRTPKEKGRWQEVMIGWTIRDNKENTIGLGRPPFQKKEDAELHADRWNSRDDTSAA